MADVREVVIEIMRHGPPHNQLLSPTTRYLALCGSHPAVTLTIPTEHHKVIHLLARMVDQPGTDRQYIYEREELKALVTSLLGQLPALPNETRAGHDTLIHLRLTITAQELALLPFELSSAPAGVSQSSQPLLLGPEPNILLTREIRRSTRPQLQIPQWMRVLVVAADPDDRGLPLVSTIRRLEASIAPLLRPGLCNGEMVADPGDAIRVLYNASVDDVRGACYEGDYSHVHFLAHGDVLPGRDDAFGMVLANRQKSGREVVDGESLARALTPPTRDGGHTRPWCVTLATCQSSLQERVPLVPQTSLAHALHEVGIPTVIASQFPLTFGAADEMTPALYAAEASGDDIRFTLRSLRHQVGSRMRNTYDWAGLAFYAGWPRDLSEQARRVHSLRSVQQLEAANAWADDVITLWDDEEVDTITAAGVALDRIDRVVDALEGELERLDQDDRASELQDGGNDHWFNTRHTKDAEAATGRVLRTEFFGLLGSVCKRRARLQDFLGRGNDAERSLKVSADWYEKGAETDTTSHWTACQAFVMHALVLKPEDAAKPSAAWIRARELWLKAGLRGYNHAAQDEAKATWALTTLIEVELWRRFFEDRATVDARELQPEHTVIFHLQKLLELTGPESFPINSTRRQLQRYLDWWLPADYAAAAIDEDRFAAPVEGLLKRFPPRTDPQQEVKSRLTELGARSLADDAEPDPPTDPDLALGGDRVVRAKLGDRRPRSGPDGQSFFRVQMLPARGGDALWIEYGQADEVHRILIDGGYRSTIANLEPRINEIAAQSEDGRCHFDLVVVSHIDADHIEGIIELLGSRLPIKIHDLWFNGRRHHPRPPAPPEPDPEDQLGGKHGLFLDTLIDLFDAQWNRAFHGGTVVVPPRPDALPQVRLRGGMTLTLLSPNPTKLDALASEWDDNVAEAKLDGASVKQVLAAMRKLHYRTDRTTDDEATLRARSPEDPIDMDELLQADESKDPGKANGASIAFIAEFAGRSVLFAGDAHHEVLLDSLERLHPDGRVGVGAVKLSHHGSWNNLSDDLLRKIRTRTFMVSTNGSHSHPDRETIARIIGGSWRLKSFGQLRLLFNYERPTTTIWNDVDLMAEDAYHYETHFPTDGDVIELDPVPVSP